MVGVPLAVAAGETLPHCAALQLAETETVIGRTTIVGELPPQLTMIVTEDKPRSEMANHAVRFICASASAILAMAVTARPPLGR